MLTLKTILSLFVAQLQAAQTWFSDNGSEIAVLLIGGYIAVSLYRYWANGENRSLQTLLWETATRIGVVAILVVPNGLCGGLAPVAWLPGAIMTTGIDLGEAACTAVYGGGVTMTQLPKRFQGEIKGSLTEVKKSLDSLKEQTSPEQYDRLTRMLAANEGGQGFVGAASKMIAGASASMTMESRAEQEQWFGGQGFFASLAAAPGALWAGVEGFFGTGAEILQRSVFESLIVIMISLTYWSMVVLYFCRGMIYGLFFTYSVCTAAISHRSGMQTLTNAILRGAGLLVFPASLVGAFRVVEVAYVHVIKPYLFDLVLGSFKGQSAGSDMLTQFMLTVAVGVAFSGPLVGILLGVPTAVASFIGANVMDLGGRGEAARVKPSIFSLGM